MSSSGKSAAGVWGWRLGWPDSYERLIGRPVADYRRTYLVYRRRWRTICERHGLTISQRGKPDTDPLVPDLSSVRIGAAVDTLKPSWGRLGRVRDLQRRRESCRFAPSVGRDRRRGKGQKWRRTGPDCSQARPLRQHRGQAAAKKPAFLGTVCGNCRSHGGPSRIGISRRLQTHSELRVAALLTFAILHICAALHP
jgi:hypothetical protein